VATERVPTICSVARYDDSMKMQNVPLFKCKWHNLEGQFCSRSVEKGHNDYCKWHLMSNRLASIWSLRNSLIRQCITVAMFVIASRYFQTSKLHFSWFRSGIDTNKDVEFNPEFALLFLGLAVLFIGLCLSSVKREDVPEWFDRHTYLCFVSLLGLSATLYWTNPDFLFGVSDLLFMAAMGVLLLRLDKLTGRIAPIVVLSGLFVIFAAGLITLIMEILYHFAKGLDYMPPVATGQRGLRALDIITSDLTVSSAAVEAAIALRFTGRMLTLRFDATIILALVVVFGQAHILRQALLIYLGQYVLDNVRIPIPGAPSIFYLAIVLCAHYTLLRRGATGKQAL
jgi:hypothetical protein